ncbi:hypothetical protein NMY22_g18167 [Coprinellus aureogranulatus]|nr:hypothetical protein NMY22_g18167 [Coprinellus aureogranulatus]
MSLEHLFSTSELNLVIPDTSLEFPPESSADEWLGRVKIGKIERKQAFFGAYPSILDKHHVYKLSDEQLQSLLLLRIRHPTPDIPADPKSPPAVLLDSQRARANMVIAAVRTTQGQSTLAPPRLASAGLSAPPTTGDQDRQYAASEGVFLAAIIWGADARDAFSLLWSEKEKLWVAVYRLSLTVSFLKTANFSNPLLCLTTAATLREKPIITSDKHPLSKYLSTLGITTPESPTVKQEKKDDYADDTLLDGLEEVNLLEGLLAGPDFAKAADQINVPSIRLGATSRQKLFSLPPILSNAPKQPSPSPMTAVRKAHPTLRKSYRRTLPTVSTFQLRMRTVFVPYVLLPGTEGTVADIDETEIERERREAGSAERTVVLCIEIKNSGGQEAQSGIGFMVESVDIKIAGEGAKTTLVGWGEDGLSADAAKTTFPLKLGPFSQVNLLYAVTFLRSPEQLDSFSFAKPDAKVRSELRRGVSITVNGKPYTPLTPSARALLTEPDAITLPTRTFASSSTLSTSPTRPQAIPLHSQNPRPPSPRPRSG